MGVGVLDEIKATSAHLGLGFGLSAAILPTDLGVSGGTLMLWCIWSFIYIMCVFFIFILVFTPIVLQTLKMLQIKSLIFGFPMKHLSISY